ncbi:MAG: alpha/beta hydrolase [Pseudomonadota bacterium]
MLTINLIITVCLVLYLLLIRASTLSPPPKIYNLFVALQGLIWPDVHEGRPNPCAKITDDLRYPDTPPPPNTASKHGEIEILDDGTPVTHWYAEAAGVTFHFVTAGDPSKQAVLMLHGLPESWWAFHHQIAALSDDYYVIALDCKGYGQSDKRLELDYQPATMAKEVAALLKVLNIEEFNIVAHDRGVIIADHMTSVSDLKGKILRYVRMQQSFNEPHGEPAPPHDLFATKLGEANWKSKNIMSVVYGQVMAAGLSPTTLKRLNYEFKFKGVAEAIRVYFATTNFAIELKDRHDFLFEHMTMPMLILQAKWDPGQHMEEYANSPSFVTNARVQFVEANHFSHIENPTAVSAAITQFLSEAA